LLAGVTLAAAAVSAPACRRAETPAGSDGQAGSAWFEEVAVARGLAFRHRSGHEGRYLLPEIMGGGAALFDMDGDGDLDVFLVQSGRVGSPPGGDGDRLFRNDGHGFFEDVTSAAVTRAAGYGMGVAAGDYDNDGDVDLYVTALGPNTLLANDGRGAFTDVTARAGVAGDTWSTGAAWLDYDLDGDLDLFVLNYINWSESGELECFSLTGVPDYCSPRNYDAPTADTLYRNNGDGTFTDVTAAAGLLAAFGNGLGIVAGDVNGDGRPDVFVANDAMPNQLWINAGNGTFRDEALLAGVAVDQDGSPKSGMGVDAVDLDDDGDLDLLVVNLDGESDSFFRNEGAFFVDDTARVGLRAASRRFTRFGTAFLDFDNDGWLDLYEANGRVGQQSERFSADPFAEPNLLFRGGPDGFVEVAPRGGTAVDLAHSSRAATFGDVDNDGGLDILVANRDAEPYLLRNVATRGHWLLVRVVDERGRDAFGAELAATVGGRRLRRTVRSAYSYLAANDARVHLGLGPATAAADVEVRWPDGAREAFGSLQADRIVVLRRGEGRIP
jgi:hypothetical protein